MTFLVKLGVKSTKSPRIISGKYKNYRLRVPASARPMTDRIKQSVFDLISEFIPNANVLDLYAGAGNLGIEALSRGASSCVFVEADEQAAELITLNLSALIPMPTAEVKRMYVEKFFSSIGEKRFDLIFADPPFPIAEKFKHSETRQLLTEEGLLIYRVPANKPQTFVENPVHTEVYGESIVYFLRQMQ